MRAGSARDYILGFSAVNGFGEIWKAGGKVVKNVTGYDMCKLQAGAYGTLSALTELTIKVMPKPETACTIVLHGLADDVAIPALANALNSPFEVSGAAHLPASAARRSKVGAVAAGLGAATALRLEGPRPSVAYRTTRSKPWSGAARVSTRRRRRPSGPRSAPFSHFSHKDRASFGGSVRRQATRRPSPIRFSPRLRRRNFTSIGAAG